MAYLNPVQVLTPTSFCYVASANVRISLLNFLTFSFNPFTTLVLSYKAVNSVSPKSLNLNQKLRLKNVIFWFFLVTSLKNWLTSYKCRSCQTLVTWPHLQYNSCTWQNFAGEIMVRNYNVITFIQSTYVLRRPRAANFPGIIKIATIFNKTGFKDSKQVKRIRNCALKCNLYLYSLLSAILLFCCRLMKYQQPLISFITR